MIICTIKQLHFHLITDINFLLFKGSISILPYFHRSISGLPTFHLFLSLVSLPLFLQFLLFRIVSLLPLLTKCFHVFPFKPIFPPWVVKIKFLSMRLDLIFIPRRNLQCYINPISPSEFNNSSFELFVFGWCPCTLCITAVTFDTFYRTLATAGAFGTFYRTLATGGTFWTFRTFGALWTFRALWTFGLHSSSRLNCNISWFLCSSCTGHLTHITATIKLWISRNKFGMLRLEPCFLILLMTLYIKCTRSYLCGSFCGDILGNFRPASPTVNDDAHFEVFLFFLRPQ
mmetsp:Transcript_37093/g.54574  ORF Transcript_37093/g.54574 Transcript_37093/m.54574 type:complete len:287 (-) Transcript_37093:608-1468(-)